MSPNNNIIFILRTIFWLKIFFAILFSAKGFPI